VKVIFLDFDGVLNSTRSVLAKSGKSFWPAGRREVIDFIKQNFGDIHGVLPDMMDDTFDTIDPVAVGLVNRLLRKDESLHIVLSTSHRTAFTGPRFGRNIAYNSDEHLVWLRYYMRALGFINDDRIVAGITPKLYKTRGEEVRTYLEQHPEITTHVAIDDSADFAAEDCNLIRTSAVEGFSAEDFYKVAEILNINESSIILL
jgi:hypothetical protein